MKKTLVIVMVLTALAILTTGVALAQAPQPPAPRGGGMGPGGGFGPMGFAAGDEVGPMHEYTAEKGLLESMMLEKGIRQITKHWVERIETGNQTKVIAYNLYRDGYRREGGPVKGKPPRRVSGATVALDCDSVVLVTARVANRALWDALKARKAEWAREGVRGIYQAGDGYAPRMIADAIFDAHRIAREFESPDPQRPLPPRRELIRWPLEDRVLSWE